jgi:hypothetical protein
MDQATTTPTIRFLSSDRVEALKPQVGESLVNVKAAVSESVLKSQSVVFNRLDRIREIEINDLTPPAAASGRRADLVSTPGSMA